MIRFLNFYIPGRTLLLVGGEIAAVCLSFVFAVFILFRTERGFAIADQHVAWKILSVAVLVLFCSHYFEMYDQPRLSRPSELYPRILQLVAIISFTLAAVIFLFPTFSTGRNFFLIGLVLLTITWVFWRWAYIKLISLPMLRERVYVVGDGDRAMRIRETIKTRWELGMDLLNRTAGTQSRSFNCESIGAVLRDLASRHLVDRVIVALPDRRSTMPVYDLLDLRLRGIHIDDGTSLLEKVSGKIEVDELHPSWMIFGDGFRLTRQHWFLRRIFSTLLALALTIATLPLLPFIILLIKLTSRGPVLFKQKRVGLQGRVFDCYKFRSMRQDAEADTGPTWASDDDPRITRVGKFLRRTRLDEIPQIWNVLRGDMAFVGPRPERPEFVAKLSEHIPYYRIRQAVRPGITGWAQINYGYGSSVEESKEKLRFDLYYIRHVSVVLDLWIVLYTIRAVIIGRGVR